MTATSRIQDFIGEGTHAARPSTPTTNYTGTPVPGNLYYETDTAKLFFWDQGTTAWVQVSGAAASGANPTATGSDTAVNGTALTFLRSDGAPAIQKTSSSVFGLCKVDNSTITASGGVITATASGGSGLFSQVLSTLPTDAGIGWSAWLNQSTATTADDATGQTIVNATSHASDSLNVRHKAKASNPVSYTALISMTADNVQNVGCGIGFDDGTKLQTLNLTKTSGGIWALRVTNWTNTTTFSANVSSADYPVGAPGPIWLKVQDDGTNLNYSFSFNGARFFQFYTNTVANFLSAATNIGFFFNAWGAGSASVLSWTQGT